MVRIALPYGRIAFGRVLRDASIAIYRGTWNGDDRPPIGSRDFVFVVGIYDVGTPREPQMPRVSTKSRKSKAPGGVPPIRPVWAMMPG